MELFSEHKDSKLLGGYCMHKMSMAGHNTGTRPLCPSALPHACTLVLAPDLPCACLAPVVCVCVCRDGEHHLGDRLLDCGAGRTLGTD